MATRSQSCSPEPVQTGLSASRILRRTAAW
jgi:hypothetical protein